MKEKNLEIIEKTDAISVEKDNGTLVDYFLFEEFELHYNTIPINCVQDWHSHHAIEEIIVVEQGEIVVEWIENGKIFTKIVKEKEIIRMKNSIHRLSNRSNTAVECTIFRFVPQHQDYSQKIKKDKTSYSINDIQLLLDEK